MWFSQQDEQERKKSVQCKCNKWNGVEVDKEAKRMKYSIPIHDNHKQSNKEAMTMRRSSGRQGERNGKERERWRREERDEMQCNANH